METILAFTSLGVLIVLGMGAFGTAIGFRRLDAVLDELKAARRSD